MVDKQSTVPKARTLSVDAPVFGKTDSDASESQISDIAASPSPDLSPKNKHNSSLDDDVVTKAVSDKHVTSLSPGGSTESYSVQSQRAAAKKKKKQQHIIGPMLPPAHFKDASNPSQPKVHVRVDCTARIQTR